MDLAFHFDADLDPAFQLNADLDGIFTLKQIRIRLITLMRIRTRLPIHFDADSDRAFNSDADPSSQNDMALCESGSATLLFKCSSGGCFSLLYRLIVGVRKPPTFIIEDYIYDLNYIYTGILWRAPTRGLPPPHNTSCTSQRIRGYESADRPYS